MTRYKQWKHVTGTQEAGELFSRVRIPQFNGKRDKRGRTLKKTSTRAPLVPPSKQPEEPNLRLLGPDHVRKEVFIYWLSEDKLRSVRGRGVLLEVGSSLHRVLCAES